MKPKSLQILVSNTEPPLKLVFVSFRVNRGPSLSGSLVVP